MDKNFFKVIMYLIICILAGSVVNESTQIFFLKNKNMNIINKIEDKKIENRLLEKELALLDNDIRYITILARKNLGCLLYTSDAADE